VLCEPWMKEGFAEVLAQRLIHYRTAVSSVVANIDRSPALNQLSAVCLSVKHIHMQRLQFLWQPRSLLLTENSVYSFAALGPRLWNTLPYTFMTSYGQFRRHLKAHLFRAEESQRIVTFDLLHHTSTLTYLLIGYTVLLTNSAVIVLAAQRSEVLHFLSECLSCPPLSLSVTRVSHALTVQDIEIYSVSQKKHPRHF